MGKDKALLIDTGLGVQRISEIVERLTNLPIVVITTHVHLDHIGGHREFKNIAVYVDEIDWLTSKFPLPLPLVKQNLMEGFLEIPEDFNIDTYQIYQHAPTSILHDLEEIDLGGRCIQVIHTPGHSPGHICLYEKARKSLYTGDLIYKGTLFMHYPTTDPKAFMNSMNRVINLDVETLYPAHHSLDIDVSIMKEIYSALKQLEVEHKLYQGAGIHHYTDFSIQL